MHPNLIDVPEIFASFRTNNSNSLASGSLEPQAALRHTVALRAGDDAAVCAVSRAPLALPTRVPSAKGEVE